MSYAVVQTSPTAPTSEELVQAFAAIPSRSTHDAHHAVRRGYGILADGLEAAEVQAVAAVLAHLGVPARAIRSSELPALPPPRVLRRLECAPAALTLYDVMGRPRRFGWEQVCLLAAGDVATLAVERQVTFQRVPNARYDPIQVNLERRQRREQRPLVALGLTASADGGELELHQGEADRLLFDYLGARRRPRRLDNFLLVVSDLLGHATAAVINRGAADLAAGGQQLLAYPSEQMFQRELTWLLWWARRG